ncbi:MAG: class I SAM-dependent methyltransferase [bacterium]|nr:class I SAM-dependent methyltransferase [bacterium]MDZ4285038.1 class I SAM-dependent methyltransferase [Patescibacteria group bacterium]
MHPLNKLLSPTGWQLYRSRRQAAFPREFKRAYDEALAMLEKSAPADTDIFSEPLYEGGEHTENYIDFECEFAARHIATLHPERILDIGSYRWFVLGLLASLPVTTLDVRGRRPVLKNETVLTGDAKKLPLEDASFDMIVSLCTLEHFGLGRYGDDFDLDADHKALREMARVLAPGGSLIITTELTRGHPAIAFNAHRIYTRDILHRYAEEVGFAVAEEKFFSRTTAALCDFETVTEMPRQRDVYLGCWKRGT